MIFIKRKTCAYCDPYNDKNHIKERIEIILFPLNYIFAKIELFLKTKFPHFYYFLNSVFSKAFFNFVIYSGVLKEIDALDNDEQLHNRSLVIVRAARERGVSVKALKLFGKWGTNFFSMMINGQKIIFEGLPLVEIGYTQSLHFDDKFVLKKILQNNALPYADGKTFHCLKKAIRYAEEIGFPLVVKPNCGSLSKHTICNIQNEFALKEAIRIVQIISREFILEKFIPGNVYRITAVDDNVLACCLREPPNVIGDGIHNIEELIKIKNDNPLRGDIHQKNFTLHKIHLTETTLLLLKSEKLTIKSILSKDRKVYLHNKIVLACGADIHDKTDDIHPKNKLIFSKLSQLLVAPIVGIDFICQDISIPYYEQLSAIIEANSLPYIDIHHFPVFGKSRDVAGYIVDRVFQKFQ